MNVDYEKCLVTLWESHIQQTIELLVGFGMERLFPLPILINPGIWKLLSFGKIMAIITV